MLISILAAFALACAAPWVHRRAPRTAGWILAALTGALFVYFAALLPAVADGGAVRETRAWVPALGVHLSFVADGLSLLFALLITGAGAVIAAYAGGYLRGHPQQGRFYLLLLGFMASMLGLVLADNLITLFVFWELTSLTSFFLIGFDHEREGARQAALQALLVTGGGGLALLAGFLLLGTAAGGTLELSEIARSGEAVRGHPLHLPIFLLVVVGAFTKSAQVPFHFWLPGAMAAPTPVSAFLHSATMVKAGIYLLARLGPVLGGTAVWIGTLSVVGAATMVTGAVLALRQTDLKRVLAYSTLAALGTLTLLLGLGGEAGVKAALVFLVAHALYKAALFLTAGAVDHGAGTRDLRALGGLRRAMPITAAVAVVAGVSMAGLPPLFGFLAKEVAYKALLGFGAAGLLLVVAAVLANALTLAAAGLVAVRPFFGPARTTPHPAHEVPPSMWLGPAALAAAGLALGIVPEPLAERVLAPAAAAVRGLTSAEPLSLAWGWDAALALSAVTVLLGFAAYRAWAPIHGALRRLDPLLARGPERAYDALLAGTVRVAEAQSALVQRGGLRGALLTIFGVALALAGWSAVARHGTLQVFAWPEARFHEWMLAGLIVLGTGITVITRSRLTAILSLGLIGFLTALWYLLLGAPDLAMTQFLVETLIVVILALVLPRLPRLNGGAPPRGSRLRDGAIALGVGGLMTGLLLAVTRLPFDTRVSDFFLRQAVPEAHGRNVVNVILVDFRALDTLGEVTVLAVAALGVHALLRSTRSRWTRPGGTVVLRGATRLLIPLLLLLSAFLLWRGHNEAGGGFVGGLVAAGALALCAVVFGTGVARRVMLVPPRALLAAGLGVVLLSGLLGLVGGDPFLTARWMEVGSTEPLHLGTPLLFDVGVFLLVLGFTLRLILSLEEA